MNTTLGLSHNRRDFQDEKRMNVHNKKGHDDDFSSSSLGSRTAFVLSAIVPPAMLFWRKSGQHGPVEAMAAPIMADVNNIPGVYQPEEKSTNQSTKSTTKTHHQCPKLITDDRLRQPANRNFDFILLPDFPTILRKFRALHILWKISIGITVFFNPLIALAAIFLVQVQLSVVRGAKAVTQSRFASLDFWGPVGKMIQHRWARFRHQGKVGRWTLVTIGILIDPRARKYAQGYVKDLGSIDDDQNPNIPHPQAGALPKARAFFHK